MRLGRRSFLKLGAGAALVAAAPAFIPSGHLDMGVPTTRLARALRTITGADISTAQITRMQLRNGLFLTGEQGPELFVPMKKYGRSISATYEAIGRDVAEGVQRGIVLHGSRSDYATPPADNLRLNNLPVGMDPATGKIVFEDDLEREPERLHGLITSGGGVSYLNEGAWIWTSPQEALHYEYDLTAEGGGIVKRDWPT